MRREPEEIKPNVSGWQIDFARQAQKDSLSLAAAGLRPKAEALLAILRINSFQTPPPYEKLVCDLAGIYSRRINIQHRLVYEADKKRILSKFSECGHTTGDVIIKGPGKMRP